VASDHGRPPFRRHERHRMTAAPFERAVEQSRNPP
jgi:hypothetical protein